ncbi:MAG: hypothetical protein RJB66_2639 [Pseudomonadota bacterium]|jgi:hypothetical protein
MELQKLLSSMWIDYRTLNPSAGKIFDLFTAEGENVVNDHIALRTFKHPRLGLESMAKTFKMLGYCEMNDYHFKAKKLYAKHYEHSDETMPKIFISELLLEQMSVATQAAVESIIEQIPDSVINSPEFSLSGRSWNLSYKTYEQLAAESEYASWLAAVGFRPNHFTVFVNNMKKYNTIQKVNELLEARGYALNASGGKIKGTPEELLEQSSTMAELVRVGFDDGFHEVPGCYYEFARRYQDQSGRLYQGFVATSADKIFESTNRM